MSLTEVLLELYRKSDSAYTGEWALYSQAKRSGVRGVTRKKVKDFWRKNTDPRVQRAQLCTYVYVVYSRRDI